MLSRTTNRAFVASGRCRIIGAISVLIDSMIPRLSIAIPAILLCASVFAVHAEGEPRKVLHLASLQSENSFDPAFESEEASLQYCENMFDAMLTYDYLARPAKLVPNTLAAMPELADNGATYTFRIRPGIYFAVDPAFKGKRRELVAADYVFSLKRLLDPNVRSPWKFLLDGKILGADKAVAAAKSSGRFDYDTPIEGLREFDRYTLRIRLTAPDFKLPYILATPATGALAREVVEAYGSDIGAHPVGTGPYLLKEWKRSSRVVLEANPGYREERFAAEPEDTPWDAAIMKALAGRRIPLNDRIEVNVIEEGQPRWLAFLNREIDLIEILPEEFANVAAPNGRIAPNLAKQGIRLFREAKPDVWFTYFNMEDPVVGGYTPEKIALRRAIASSINTRAEIAIVRNNQALQAQSVIPPGIVGYDPDFRNPFGEYNPARAKALLDLFGYLDRDGDGFRELPDGRPLVIEYASQPTLAARRMDELIQRSLEEIGIRITLKKEKVPELRKLGKQGKLQMRTDGWQADYPDAENFFQLLYGPNAGQANYSRFRLAQFDRIYEKTAAMPDSAERNALYRQMSNLVLVYAPWRMAVHRLQNHLLHPWVAGYKKHPFVSTAWRYLDVDVAQRDAAKR
jgi:oligopeptide transport system substrate-binding protein